MITVGNGADRTIELIGLPGGGKTTLLRAARLERDPRLLERSEVEAHVASLHARRPRPLRWASLLSYCAAQHAMTRALLGYERAFSPRSHWGLRNVYRFLRRAHNDHMLRAAGTLKGRTVVYDQGAVQQIWSIGFLRGLPPSNHLDRVLAACASSLPEAIVWVDCAPETALGRMRARLASRGAPLGDFEVLAEQLDARAYGVGYAHLAQLFDACAARGVEVLRLDMEMEQPEAVRALRRALPPMEACA